MPGLQPALLSQYMGDLQKRKFCPHYESAKSYYVSATAIVIGEPQQRFTKPRTGRTRYALCTVYHITAGRPVWKYRPGVKMNLETN